MKLLARDDDRRPQDLIDLRALLAVASRSDRAAARAAVRLVTRRGFDRGRDLAGDLRRLVRGLKTAIGREFP